MEAIARGRFARFAPRKVNQVLGLIRRKPVPKALTALSFVTKSCATFIGKTIKSAAANAGDPEAKNPRLIVSGAWVGQGPVMKRMRAHAMGRGATYKRKTCHLTVVVSDQSARGGR
ncbi:MAG: 50S ribosomal protein L22 [Elusimicrobia bacterium RIFCSPLOWO2_01_FULL_64_13]|nr:MAG: 50S ribosomal protein L22 [Elusimicrobia bacterium RIFCSPHIGHO2_01_FULL_64_10]OGR95422.1 MAG: 50S ribosomal protein L22 [Elusimicrobia bacterium RIFCSPLOWO2_01_FULL_64_13]